MKSCIFWEPIFVPGRVILNNRIKDISIIPNTQENMISNQKSILILIKIIVSLMF